MSQEKAGPARAFFLGLGCVIAGALVMYITWYFITKFQSYTAIALGTVFTAIFGGVVVVFVAQMAQDRKLGSALYLFGLLIGTLVYFVAFWLVHIQTGTHGPIIPVMSP